MSAPNFDALGNVRTRRQLQLLHAQAWADFKQHWPMEVFDLFCQIVGGFLFGVALALASFIYFLPQVVA